MSIRGYVDAWESTIIGWAFDENEPDRVPTIVVQVDGKVVVRGMADQDRQDLIPAIGLSHRGFAIDIYKFVWPGTAHTISIIAEGSTSQMLGENRVTFSKKVEEGANGWLYLVNDANKTDAQMAGHFAEAQAEPIANLARWVSLRKAQFAQWRIPYEMIVMPERNICCQANRPQQHYVSNDRPVMTLCRQLDRLQCERPIYPYEYFAENAQSCFTATDTHASSDGYIHVLKLLQDKWPLTFPADFEPDRKLCVQAGDLAAHLPQYAEILTKQFTRLPGDQIITYVNTVEKALGAGSRLRGSYVHMRQRKGNGQRLLVHGTSSAYYGLPMLQAIFSETLFYWENSFDYELVLDYKPTFVLWLATERFLPASYNDITGIPELFIPNITTKLKN